MYYRREFRHSRRYRRRNIHSSRLKATVYSHGDEIRGYTYDSTWASTGHNTRKFTPWMYPANEYQLSHSGFNYPVVRYADVLLMYAEALYRLGRETEAYPYVNLVRNRANPALPTVQDLMSQNNWDFFEALMHERRVELGLEGWRWFDLVRWGIAKEIMLEKENKTVPDRELLLPLPQVAMDLNENLVQNPGYN